MMMRTGLQFDRAEYEAEMVSLAEMTPEEVVAMLLRNSLGFSRCTQSACARARWVCNASAYCVQAASAHWACIASAHWSVSQF